LLLASCFLRYSIFYPETRQKNMAKQTKSTAKKSVEDSSTDEAFQALLSSQRDILSRLNFGSSSSTLEYVEGPENLPIVSPNNSAEFNTSQSDYGHHYENTYEDGLRDSHHSMGVGDDRFILDHITVEAVEATGPQVVDFEAAARMRRKRECEEELVEFVSRKKRRNTTSRSTTYDSMLPEPDDLAELDDSSTSLLLDDLDFPSIHSATAADLIEPGVAPSPESPVEEDASTSGTEKVTEASSSMDTSDESLTIKASNYDEEAPAEPERAAVAATEVIVPPKRSQRDLWKPKRRHTIAAPPHDAMEITSEESDSMNASLRIEDLETPARVVSRNPSSNSQQKTLHVSVLEGEDDDDDEEDSVHSTQRSPSLSSSSGSLGAAPTVEALSAALQKSIDTTKSIQEWDRKMGLKRSHSKTMRLSSQSRQKLLQLLIQEEAKAKKAAAAQQTSSAAATADDDEKMEESKPAIIES
jgi:hypothetical protein